MLKSLRNKFLIINMTGTVLILLVTMTIIYFITSSNIERSINQNLQRQLEIQPKSPPSAEIGMSDGQKDPNGQNGKRPPEFDPKPKKLDDSRNFSIISDDSNNVIRVNSLLGENEELYTEISKRALSTDASYGTLKVDSLYWRYQKKDIDNGYTVIAFTDITSEMEILKNLIITIIFVGLFILILIFLASRYFATKAISPVKEAWEKQKQFVSDASHELKTPIASINANTDVLLSHGESTINSEKKWLLYIKNETDRMSSLVKNLLYLARTQNDEIVFEMQKISLSDIIESSILAMEAVIYEKQINLSYKIEPKIEIYANTEQIHHLLAVLLDNAVKYTNKDGSIEINAGYEGPNAVITIKNTGDGISPYDLAHIFDRFYRADKSREHKSDSFGLGLSIADAIAKHHNGKISAKSTPGEYTEFKITLPAKNK